MNDPTDSLSPALFVHLGTQHLCFPSICCLPLPDMDVVMGSAPREWDSVADRCVSTRSTARRRAETRSPPEWGPATRLLEGRVRVIKENPPAHQHLTHASFAAEDHGTGPGHLTAKPWRACILHQHNSVWRPLQRVGNWPLALCDCTSMTYDELFDVDLVRRDYIGSTM